MEEKEEMYKAFWTLGLIMTSLLAGILVFLVLIYLKVDGWSDMLHYFDQLKTVLPVR